MLGEPAEGDRVVLRRSCWGSGESVMRRVRVKGEGGMRCGCGAVRCAVRRKVTGEGASRGYIRAVEQSRGCRAE